MAETKKTTTIVSKVYFRVDGNTKIGLGHVIRCLALADMLHGHFECVFLVQTLPSALEKQITKNHQLINLPAYNDLQEEARAIANKHLDVSKIVVLDGYNFKLDYQKAIKANGCKLVCIDDLHAWHFVADVVINHAGTVKPSDYSHESYTKLCLGTGYALLRTPFLEVAQQPRMFNKIEKAFICFGGSDYLNLSAKTIEACLQTNAFEEIHAVLGASYPFYEELKTFAAKNPGIFLHQNLSASEMRQLMTTCELAITSASSISYEACSVGMYLIAGWYADNQKFLYQYLTENELAIGAGNFEDIREVVQTSLKVPRNYKALLQKQKKHFDGKNQRRLVHTFYETLMKVRQANDADKRLYFDWANDPEVRANAFNSEPIAWDSHNSWFNKAIRDSNRYLFTCESANVPVGQVRIDINDTLSGQEGVIDYSIDKQYRGLGLGQVIIEKAIQEVKQYRNDIKLIAKVKPENIASKKTFEKSGFTLVSQDGFCVYILNV